jgi:hypothetical protein
LTPFDRTVEDIKRRIEEDKAEAHGRLAEDLLANPTPQYLRTRTFQYVVQVFDIHAEYYHYLVSTHEDVVKFYVPYLSQLLPQTVALGEHMTSGWPPNWRMETLTALRMALLGRSSRWKSRALKRARDPASNSVAANVANEVAKQTGSPERSRIDAFITGVNETGAKVTRTDIWTVAGYSDPTEFERFQRGDQKTTTSAKQNFNRVLSMTPEVFLDALKKRQAKK